MVLLVLPQYLASVLCFENDEKFRLPKVVGQRSAVIGQKIFIVNIAQSLFA